MEPSKLLVDISAEQILFIYFFYQEITISLNKYYIITEKINSLKLL